MRRILVFAGTTEGRKLYVELIKKGIPALFCVATEYGEMVLSPDPLIEIKKGRLDHREMSELMKTEEFSMVIDATHPYAVEVTRNIRAAAETAGLSYLRLLRETEVLTSSELIRYFENTSECAKALAAGVEKKSSNVLLTTGSKELAAFTGYGALKEKLFVRVLPSRESISLCEDNGISGKQIIAMQGPFSKELNEALIRQYDIGIMVAKESGKTGGYGEKVDACKACGTMLYVIKNPDTGEGFTLDQISNKLDEIYEIEVSSKPVDITLVGVGMGNIKGLTLEAYDAIKEADLLFGAKRLTDAVMDIVNKNGEIFENCYLAENIVPLITERLEALGKNSGKVCVLFSGDTGFYSGAKKLLKALHDMLGDIAKIHIIPGISSVSYLASKLGVSYDDAAVLSVHGDKDAERFKRAVDRICEVGRGFVLLSGIEDISPMVNELRSVDQSFYIFVGRNLSYDDEEIIDLKESEDPKEIKKGSVIMYVEVFLEV